MRSSMAWTSGVGPRKAEIGSMTTATGAKRSTSRFIMVRCISSPYRLGRAASKRNRPASTWRRRSTPTERTLRTI